MRVTDVQAQAGFLRNLRLVKEDLNDALERMYTGKRVNFASDDPNAAAELMRLAEEVQRLDSRARGISQARAWLELSEQAVMETGDILIRAQTYAVQASSETNLDGYGAIADSIAHLRSELQNLAGYRVSGSYIFSGTMTTSHPYDAAGNYQGNSSSIEIPIDEGNLKLNFIATDLFGEVGTGGPMDILARLETALRAGDSTAVQAINDDIQAAINNNGTNIARVGSRREALEASDVRIQDKKVEIATRAADLGSADMAKAISDAQRLDTNYQATLSAGSRIFGPTFFDYLG